MAELSAKAIEVLRKIDEHGLHVLWSFKVPFPEYGQTYGEGDTMPDEDWQIVGRELSQTKRVEERGFFVTGRTFKRNMLFANIEITGIESKVVFRNKDAQPMPIPEGAQRLCSLLPEPLLDFFNSRHELITNAGLFQTSMHYQDGGIQVISEESDIEGDEYFNQYSEWSSEWLEREHVPMDEWFEESRGMIDRYTLTDAAKQLIAQ